MAATPPRGQKQYGRGEVSKDLETKGNAKKNLKRGEEKFETEQKFKGEPPRGETSSRKRRRNGGEQREGGGGKNGVAAVDVRFPSVIGAAEI